MARYILSKTADSDLDGIAEYGVDHFGIDQTRAYQKELIAHFELLAEQPLLYPAVDRIREGYRRSVCRAHSVYYRLTDNGIEIMAIIGRQDVSKHLPDKPA